MSPLPPQQDAGGAEDSAEDHVSDGLPKEERNYTVRAVQRVCAILNLLQESVDGVLLNMVAHAAELPKSSAFRDLWTLENHRYVERNPETGLFRLGLGFAACSRAI